MSDVASEAVADHVVRLEIQRPPNNFFDADLIEALADRFETLDADADCRAIVLAAAGKHFCAGANFGGERGGDDTERLYANAVRLFAAKTPVVAAIQGAAIGGGLGLALVADFRIATPAARFSANFARLGFHPGFGLSVTLPRLVGAQHAQELCYTGRRIGGEEAAAIGLCDRLAGADALADEALALAVEIAGSAPLAVRSIRETLRGHLAEEIRGVLAREASEQARLRATEDFREGVRAMSERRPPAFRGR